MRSRELGERNEERGGGNQGPGARRLAGQNARAVGSNGRAALNSRCPAALRNQPSRTTPRLRNLLLCHLNYHFHLRPPLSLAREREG